jgi:hypothetical protein
VSMNMAGRNHCSRPIARGLHGHNGCPETSPKALSRLNFQVEDSEKFGLRARARGVSCLKRGIGKPYPIPSRRAHLREQVYLMRARIGVAHARLLTPSIARPGYATWVSRLQCTPKTDINRLRPPILRQLLNVRPLEGQWRPL